MENSAVLLPSFEWDTRRIDWLSICKLRTVGGERRRKMLSCFSINGLWIRFIIIRQKFIIVLTILSLDFSGRQGETSSYYICDCFSFGDGDTISMIFVHQKVPNEPKKVFTSNDVWGGASSSFKGIVLIKKKSVNLESNLNLRSFIPK